MFSVLLLAEAVSDKAPDVDKAVMAAALSLGLMVGSILGAIFVFFIAWCASKWFERWL